MARLEYNVHPFWEMLSENYGIDEAFSVFAPYAGAGISIRNIDNNTVESSMTLKLNNINYVGTHFGGSLYSMCDPFFMLILLRFLGEGYMVWDRGANIQFIKPGTGTVTARFHIPDSEINEIKKTLETERKIIRHYITEVKNENGDIVAKIDKELYIRRLRKKNS